MILTIRADKKIAVDAKTDKRFLSIKAHLYHRPLPPPSLAERLTLTSLVVLVPVTS